MPAGSDLIDRIAAMLKTDEPQSALQLRARLAKQPTPRAVRYAITSLVKAGRARFGVLKNPGGREVFAAMPEQQQAAE